MHYQNDSRWQKGLSLRIAKWTVETGIRGGYWLDQVLRIGASARLLRHVGSTVLARAIGSKKHEALREDADTIPVVIAIKKFLTDGLFPKVLRGSHRMLALEGHRSCRPFRVCI